MSYIKNLLYISAAMLVASCGDKNQKSQEEISLDAIPDGSMIVCWVENPSVTAQMIKHSRMVSTLDSIEAVKDFRSGLDMYDALSKGEYAEREMVIAASSVKAKELSFLYMGRLSSLEAKSSSASADTTFSSRQYEGRQIHTMTLPKGELHYYHEGDMTIASTDELYLEQSLMQTLSGRSMADDASFAEAYERLNSSDGFTALVAPDALAQFVEKQKGFADLTLLGQLSPWVSLEAHPDSLSLTLNGVFCAEDSIRSYADVLACQPAHIMTLDSYFPSSTYAYTYLGISDWDDYFSENTLYLKSASQYHAYNANVQIYDRFFKGDSRKEITRWAGEGIAVVRATSGKYSHEQNILIARVKDSDMASKFLERIKDSTAVAPDPYRGHNIVRIGKGRVSIFADLINEALGEKGVNYATVAGDVMIAAYELNALKNTLEDIESATTLTSIASYNTAKSPLASTTAMMTMVRADLCVKEMTPVIREKRRTSPARQSEMDRYIWSHGKMLTPLRYNFMQLSTTSGVPFMNFHSLWSTDTPREAVKAWSYVMSAAPSRATLPFPNHKTGRIDVLCMDKNGYVYLLSDKGTLFWKKKLAGPVTGDVKIVDLYKNRKYQMVFTAGGRFYVIDRNGNPVTAKDKVAAARRAAAVAPTARVTSTNTVEISRSGKKMSLKVAHSPIKDAVYLRSKDILVYSTGTGQIYAMKSSGEELSGFPIKGAEMLTAEDFSKKGTLGIVTTTGEGAVTMHNIPLK